ncbi:MAG: hypothetical protein Q8L74_16585 [Nitrospirota bacterium]|nr:hypothetical protein [Nitrospirota bacterium]
MQINYFDKHARRPDDSFRLISLHNGLHVVANGYLCRVSDAEEERRVMAAFQGHMRIEMPYVDKPRGEIYTPPSQSEMLPP